MARLSTEGTSSSTQSNSVSSSASAASTGLPSHSFGEKTSSGGQVAVGLVLLLVAFAGILLASYFAWAFLSETPFETSPATMSSPKLDNETGTLSGDQDNTTMENTTMSSLSPVLQRSAPLAKAVLCAVGVRESDEIPPDGLCDYTFGHQTYTPFHKGFLGRPENDHLMFVEAASKHRRTEYGNSFPIRAVSSVLSDLDDENAPASVSYFWNKRFYHYGFVDAGLGEGYKEMTNILTALKKVQRLVAPLAEQDGRRSYTVVAWNEKGTSSLPDAVRLMRELHMPDMIVVHGHLVLTLGYGNRRKTYGPNNIFALAKDSGYVQTMGQAVDAIRKLTSLNVPAALALSVSVSSYAYSIENHKQLRPTDSKLFRDCTYDKFEPYMPIKFSCRSPGYGLYQELDYDSTHHFKFSYNGKHGRIVIWDTEGSLRAKLCSIKKNSTDLRYSLAVYNIDSDDHGNACAYDNWFGAYSRTQMVRMLSDFFWEGFLTPEDEANCVVLGEEF